MLRNSPSPAETLGYLGAKTLSFGLIFGMSSGSLQYRLNVTFEKSLEIANSYWNAFPRIKPWLNEVIGGVKDKGYITYWSGRRWHEDVDIFCYKGGNATIQGGSHDLLMVAFLRACDFIDKNHPGLPFFNLVHDEIDIEIPEELLQELIPPMQKIIEVPDLLGLSFFNESKVGSDYGSMQEWPA